MLLKYPPPHNHFPHNSVNILPTTAVPIQAQYPTVTVLYAPADRYLHFVSASKLPAVMDWQFSHVVARSKVQNWGRSVVGIAASNIALGMDVCQL